MRPSLDHRVRARYLHDVLNGVDDMTMTSVVPETAANAQEVGLLDPQALWIVAPAAALIFGALLSFRIKIGERTRSGLQHLAAGVVTAAVAADLVPEMIGVDKIPAVIIGFAIGTALVLLLQVFASDDEESEDAAPAPKKILGLLGVVGVDLAVDGLLVGIAIAVSGGGAVLGIAISIETLALGLAIGATLSSARLTFGRILFLMLVLAILLLVGGLVGLLVAGSFTGDIRTGVIAFGAAALLYLVVEELLVEAHKSGDTTIGSLFFFVGFGGGVILASLGA